MATVVVAIDFGTTFSGFSFAKMSEPDKVMLFQNWPYESTAGNARYCKTQTSLYYVRDDKKSDFRVQSWGWKALVEYRESIRKASTSSGGVRRPHQYFATQFKLLLADGYRMPGLSEPPPELTAERMVVDFLREMSQFALEHLREIYGKHFSMDNIQWCLTVPAIWTESAKQRMKNYAATAGMVKDSASGATAGSPFPLHIVLEPEAASVYCQRKLNNGIIVGLRKGDKIMVADVGGGTIDLVVHEKLDDDAQSMRVKEVVASYGSLGGGTFVDKHFYEFMPRKIGCFQSYCKEHPSYASRVNKWWQEMKKEFDGDGYPGAYLEDLPADLSKAWREYDEKRNGANVKDREEYEDLRLESQDFKAIFDPEVDKVVELIDRHVRKVRVLMVVGGFSESKYLRNQIKRRFDRVVEEVIMPEDPGTAISAGAVHMHIRPEEEEPIRSRVSKKTYGMSTSRKAEKDDPEELLFEDDDKQKRCNSVFDVFVRKGETVEVNARVKKTKVPVYHNQKTMAIKIYSCDDARDPKYVTSATGVKLEGEFVVTMECKNSQEEALDKKREIEVSMEFGASLIKVTAKRLNFGDTTSSAGHYELPVAFCLS